MTTPRSSEDYAEAKRKFAETQLASGKGMPQSRPGPVVDMPRRRRWECCADDIAIILVVLVTLTMAAGNHSSSKPRVGATVHSPAASPSISTPLTDFGGGTEPPAPFTPALNNAVSTVNSAVTRAAAACAMSCKQGGADPAALLDFIAAANPNIDAKRVANLLCDAGEANGIDPLLLACLARFESTFNIADVGGAGERGLLQVHPCHKRSMARAGLDFYCEADRLQYACMMMKRSGLRPWTVRKRALKLYKELKGE